jgi:predicted transcriptional regulator
MKTVWFEVKSPDAAMGRVIREARAGEYDDRARITFSSAESMARVLTPTRWTIVQTLTGAGPKGVREVARRVGRDVKGVHTDLGALVAAAIVDRTGHGKYLFPFDQVKVQFELHAAA